MLTTRQVRSGSTVTVELSGDFVDAASDVAARAFEWAALDAEIIDGQGALVIVALDNITALDVAAVRQLVRLQDTLRGLPARLVIAGVPPALADTFESLQTHTDLEFREPL